MLDRNGMVLTMSQTWHQVRPGEVRTDCGGCHSHSQAALAFERTVAGSPGYVAADLTRQATLLTTGPGRDPTAKTVATTVVDVEFNRDIRPILQRSCVACHSATKNPVPGNLVLDDRAPVAVRGPDGNERVPGDYARLAMDLDARWGHKPVATSGWRQTNASRYVRMFQSRRSLLAWKVFGRRLDGWTNGDHPTETVAGDPATLPKGANRGDADLDYTGTMMPPPGSSVPPLSDDEKLTIARWIDLGCPIDLGPGPSRGQSVPGWFLDETRPTLTISSPRSNRNRGPLTEIRIGMADVYTGVDMRSLSVTADVPIAGSRPGAELASFGSLVGDGIFSIPITPPLRAVPRARLTVKVRDLEGNTTSQTIRFSVGDPPRNDAGDR
jgi:hypothetical protein